MNLKTVIDAVKSAEKKGVNVLGAMVQWSVFERASAERAEFHSRLELLPGDLVDYLPREAKPGKALRRAIRKFNRTRKSRGMEIKSLGKDKDGNLLYTVIEFDKQVDKKKAEVTNREWIKLDVKSGSVEGSKPDDPKSAYTQVMSTYDQKMWAEDVRSFLVRYATKELGAFSTRPAGGSYFVPGDRLNELQGVIDITREVLGDKINWMTLPILGDDFTKQNLAEEYERRMLSDLDSFEKKIDTYFADAKAKRVTSIQRKGIRVDDLLAQALVYEALLGHKLTGIKDRLKELDKKIVAECAEAIGAQGTSEVLDGEVEDDIDAILAEVESE